MEFETFDICGICFCAGVLMGLLYGIIKDELDRMRKEDDDE